MPPAFGETSAQNSDLLIQLGIWNRKYGLGKVFDSSGGYRLASGFCPFPDVSWIQNERLVYLSLKQFVPIAPNFVIELRSPSDRLPPLPQKMQAHQDNGMHLGWLINVQDHSVLNLPTESIFGSLNSACNVEWGRCLARIHPRP